MTTNRPAIIARFALAMLLVAFGLALMLGMFHRSTSTPAPVVLVPSSATLPIPADQVDPTPAPTVTPDTTPTTVTAPAPAQIGTAVTAVRTTPTTVATPGPQPYSPPVMHRTQDGSGQCFGAGAQDLPAEDAADPTCAQPAAPTTTTIPEATPEQIAAPLASLYPTVPGYAPAQPHEGSSAAPGQHYPTCWTGCAPGVAPATTSTTATAAG